MQLLMKTVKNNLEDLKTTHELPPINRDKVPFRYLLNIKKLGGEITIEEFLYNIIMKAYDTPANPSKWGDGINRTQVPLTLNNLKYFASNKIITGSKSFEDSIETLIKLGYIKQYDSKYRIVSHPWK